MVAATVAASFSASAALYNVYKYEPVVDANAQTFGSAVQESTGGLSCWSSDCSDHETVHKIGYEEQRFLQGFEYRNEAPFLFEYGYEYLEDDRDGFEDYCNRYLDYADTLCEKWAYRQYDSGYAKEGSLNNSYAFVENSSSPVQGSQDNVVINKIDISGNALGNYYGGSLKNRTKAFDGTTELVFSGVQSKVFAKISGVDDIQVGSVSFSTSNANDFRSQAAIWVNGTEKLITTSGAVSSRSMPQGSARDIADVGGTVYAVGYNANKDEIPVAAVFNLSTPTSPTTEFVGTYTDDEKYLNSLLTSVNDKGIAIGTAKYREANDGAYSNSLFYVPDVTASSLSSKSFSGDIFFKSANGKAGAINNNSEVVGAVDYERHRESNGGKPRAQRAFIAPLSSADAKAPLGNKAWYLDDLTNGIAANNQFRIIDAADINDAGVIAGTAYYCAGGYDSSAINASCSSGASLVAVKLVPINGATASNISARPVDKNKVERQGGTIGVWALTILALFGFRRK